LAHGCTRLIVAAMAIALAAVPAAPASAGTFHVYGLGLNSAGCPNGWKPHTFAADRFRQADFCSRWEIQSLRDGPLREGDAAGASMFTDAGARFTGFSMRSHGTARNGTMWEIAMCPTPYVGCSRHWPHTGTWHDAELALGSLAPGGAPIYARHLWAGVTCIQDKCADSVSAGRAVQVTQRESHAVVEDYTAPGAPSVTGVSTGWNSGVKRLNYSASDAGSGVESVQLTIDGSLNRTTRHGCARLPAGGYSHPVPCATATGGLFTLNEPGQLADGKHSLTVTSRDAGGLATSRSQVFHVDNNAPGHPVGLEVVGGDGWRGVNEFAVRWVNPEQGPGSAIAAAYYRIGSPPTSATDGTRVSGVGLTQISQLEVPRDGEWPVYVWLRDEAGNARPDKALATQLRLDSTAPSLAFLIDKDAHNPAEVRVRTSDRHSGVKSGRIEIRRRGIADWIALDTRREGTDLVATIPDDRLERGAYELRATATDAVGNVGETMHRTDGRPMVVDLPLRLDTTLTANLARRAGGAVGGAPRVRVAYRARPWLRGVLRADGVRLPDTRIIVLTRRLAGGNWQQLTELLTDGNGGYAVRLPAGASREIRVRFPGNRSLRPVDDVAQVLVRGRASLRLRPRRLHRGETITFRGRVRHLDAAIPAAGKLIQIQYLDGRRWRPAVKLGRTDGRGRFAIRYRFRRISRPTRIYFRILVPAEGAWPYATGASKIRIARVRP